MSETYSEGIQAFLDFAEFMEQGGEPDPDMLYQAFLQEADGDHDLALEWIQRLIDLIFGALENYSGSEERT